MIDNRLFKLLLLAISFNICGCEPMPVKMYFERVWLPDDQHSQYSVTIRHSRSGDTLCWQYAYSDNNIETFAICTDSTHYGYDLGVEHSYRNGILEKQPVQLKYFGDTVVNVGSVPFRLYRYMHDLPGVDDEEFRMYIEPRFGIIKRAGYGAITLLRSSDPGLDDTLKMIRSQFEK